MDKDKLIFFFSKKKKLLVRFKCCPYKKHSLNNPVMIKCMSGEFIREMLIF